MTETDKQIIEELRKTSFKDKYGLFDWNLVEQFILAATAKTRAATIEQIQWEISEVLIKEREISGHIDLAAYLKHLDKLKAEQEGEK